MFPQLALLVEAFDLKNEASIEAIGSVDEMLELKENVESEFKERFGALMNIIEKAGPNKMPKLHLPVFHVLIVDRQVTFNLNRRFRLHHYYKEVFELVNNVSLVQNYASNP